MTWTGKILPFNLLYLFVFFKICHNLDILVGMYHWSTFTLFVET